MSHRVISMTSLSSDRSIVVEEGADVIFYNGVVVDGVVLLLLERESGAGAAVRYGRSGGDARINVAGHAIAKNSAIEVGKGGRGLVEGSAMWEEASHFPNYVEFSIKSTYENAELAFSTIPTS